MRLASEGPHVLKSKVTMTASLFSGVFFSFLLLRWQVSELEDPRAAHHVARDVLQLEDGLDADPQQHCKGSGDVS